MHITLDTLIFGTGITVLTGFIIVVSFCAGIGFALITWTAIREFPIFLLRRIKNSFKFTIESGNGHDYVFNNGMTLLNIGRFAIVIVSQQDTQITQRALIITPKTASRETGPND